MTIACLILGAVVLVWLTLIDLKLRLLPDVLVAAFAVLGIVFHLITHFSTLFVWWDMLAGAAVGGLVLYLIRAGGNRVYGFETMGLGDVKLMIAGGIWLGTQNIVLALGLGSLCGVLHGVGFILADRLRGKHTAFRGLTIPAGPGFIAGIALIGLWRAMGGSL